MELKGWKSCLLFCSNFIDITNIVRERVLTDAIDEREDVCVCLRFFVLDFELFFFFFTKHVGVLACVFVGSVHVCIYLHQIGVSVFLC